LLQAKDVIGLRDPDLLGLERAHRVGDLLAAAQAEMNEPATRQRQILRTDRRETEPACRGIERLRGHIGAHMDDHLAGDETRFAARRNAGEAGFTRERTQREAIAGKPVEAGAASGGTLRKRPPAFRAGWTALGPERVLVP